MKGGGGVLAYVSTKLPARRLKPQGTFKTIETLALEVKIANTHAVILGVYRPPRSTGPS